MRELKNAMERSVYRSDDPEQPITKIAFDPFDSPFKLAESDTEAPAQATARRAPLLPADLTKRLRDTERDLLTAALDKARFNQRVAADLLGLSYHQFRGKLRKHDIPGVPEEPDGATTEASSRRDNAGRRSQPWQTSRTRPGLPTSLGSSGTCRYR